MIRDILFPPRCPICEKIVSKLGIACEECKRVLPYVKTPRCKKCGKSISNVEKEYCADCAKRSYSYKEGKAVWDYDKKMAASIARFKYKSKAEYAAFYAEEMAHQYGEWLIREGIEALLPVPIHKAKRNIRGYNQAELIAVQLGEKTGLPVIPSGLLRIKDTKPQKELTPGERARNLKQAFRANEASLFGIKKIALLDDIYTTGSTIDACAKVLVASGVEEVYFLSVCIGSND